MSTSLKSGNLLDFKKKFLQRIADCKHTSDPPSGGIELAWANSDLEQQIKMSRHDMKELKKETDYLRKDKYIIHCMVLKNFLIHNS